jgi:hypothetical protein
LSLSRAEAARDGIDNIDNLYSASYESGLAHVKLPPGVTGGRDPVRTSGTAIHDSDRTGLDEGDYRACNVPNFAQLLSFGFVLSAFFAYGDMGLDIAPRIPAQHSMPQNQSLPVITRVADMGITPCFSSRKSTACTDDSTLE